MLTRGAYQSTGENMVKKPHQPHHLFDALTLLLASEGRGSGCKNLATKIPFGGLGLTWSDLQRNWLVKQKQK